MSNFLSNFTSDNYQNKSPKDKKKSSDDLAEIQVIGQQENSEGVHKQQAAGNFIEKEKVRSKKNRTAKAFTKVANDDLLVKDTAFAKKRLIKRLCLGGVTLLSLGCIFGFYYNQTHIK